MPSALLFSVVLTIAAWGNCPLAPEPFDVDAAPLMSGNGRLTVGVDASGRISVCRWPRLSDANQAPSPEVQKSDGGRGYPLSWAIRLSDRVLRLGDAPWKVRQQYVGNALARIETRFELSTSGSKPVTVRQSVFVCPGRDVVVVHLLLVGGQAGPSAPLFYWIANFSPCTRQVPEWPGANDFFEVLNDFAAYTPDQGKTMVHFRPRDAGAESWTKAEYLSQQPMEAAAAEWASFGEGAWIAYGSTNEVLGFQCGEEGQDTSALEQAGTGNLAGSAAAAGLCDSALALLPAVAGPAVSATVMIAFGEDLRIATENLRAASQQGYEALVKETEIYWEEKLSGVSLPSVEDAPLLLACKRDLVTVLQCMDPDSGAIVRSPMGDSLLALDWVRDGAWATLALDKAGYREAAGRHTFFYANAFRKQEKLGEPFGSIPASLYTNGVQGAPHLILDVDAVAWALGSFWRHATFLEGDTRKAYLAEIWGQFAGAADFLAGWTDGRTRMPLYAFDYEACRDGFSEDRLLTTYMGMDACLRIAQELGHTPPDASGLSLGAPFEEWMRRKRDLDALIRFHCVDKTGQWQSDAILPYWQFETELPSWAASAKRHFDEVEQSDTLDIAALCETALVWQGQPGKLARLRTHLGKAGIARPDSLASAQHYIAASIIYAPPKMP